MDARDLIDEIMLNNSDIESAIEILENIIIEFDKNTTNSRDRTKIIKFLDKFYVIFQIIAQKNKDISKKCENLWDIVIKLVK